MATIHTSPHVTYWPVDAHTQCHLLGVGYVVSCPDSIGEVNFYKFKSFIDDCGRRQHIESTVKTVLTIKRHLTFCSLVSLLCGIDV